MKAQSFIKGALIISAGGIAAKILGALYRIPLANILGGEGMGIYQMVYPFYCLLLTLSATGVPSALCRLVARECAQGNGGEGVLRGALPLFALLGGAGALVMYFAAPFLAGLQREAGAVAAYRALAPSVFFVSVLSCFRGYFQGRNRFLPTAVSELLEQGVRVAAGLYFARLYAGDIPRAAAGALWAVTAGEALTALYLFALYRFSSSILPRPLYRERRARVSAPALLRFVLPVALSAGILPLSHILDSVVIVRMLSGYAEGATALYGIFAGGASAVANLPVSVCYGLAAAVIPHVAALYAKGRTGEAEEKILFALRCTFFLSLPAAAFLFAFPAQISALLFPSLTGEQAAWTARLLRILSVGVIFLSGVQTLAACLTGRGKPQIAAFAMAGGVAVKLALELLLLREAKISLSGAAIAATACYFVALLVDLLYSIRDGKNLSRAASAFVRFAAAACAAAGAAYLLRHAGALAAFAVMAGLYLPLCLLLRCFSREELGIIARRKEHDHHRRFGLLPGRSHGGRQGSDPLRR